MPVYSPIVVIGSVYSCEDATTDLQIDNLIGGETFQWFFDGDAMVGEVASLITVPVSGTPPRSIIGTYSCVVTPLVGLPEEPSVTILEGVQCPPAPVIEVVPTDAPEGICDVNPTTLTLRIVGGFLPEVTYLWSTSETTETIQVDYSDTFTLTASSSTGCFRISNAIAIDVSTNNVEPTIDTAPPGTTTIAPGSPVTLVSDRHVSWYRSADLNPGAFIGRGQSIEVTLPGFYTAWDACGNKSATLELALIPGIKIQFRFKSLANYYSIEARDVRIAEPFKIIAFLPKLHTRGSIIQGGTELACGIYSIKVITDIDENGLLNAWMENYTTGPAMAYIESLI